MMSVFELTAETAEDGKLTQVVVVGHGVSDDENQANSVDDSYREISQYKYDQLPRRRIDHSGHWETYA